MKARSAAARRGITLIETVMAVVVAGIAVPPMLWSIAAAHAHRAAPVQSSQARWIAIERLEEVIADRHSETRGWNHVVNASYPDETPVATAPGFDRRVRITETGADLAGAGVGYKVVVVTVEWTGGDGSTRSLSISTVVTEYTA